MTTGSPNTGMVFSVNLSMLWTEMPFLERFAAAREAGFEAVEFLWPTGVDLDALRGAVRAADLQVALFNFYAGDMQAGERGLLSIPEREEEFRQHVPAALGLAADLGCSRIHALVGLTHPGLSRADQLRLAAANVRWAADLARDRGDVQILIEPLNRFDHGRYLLTHVNEAAELIEAVDRPNVRLQFDCHHIQRTSGDIVANARRLAHLIGHVQLADSPDRHEPGTGEINFRYVIDELDRIGYRGYVGLEYVPQHSTADSLAWLAHNQRSGTISPELLFEPIPAAHSRGQRVSV